jgi:nitrate/nitrite-specific signal transduction histidine kinase
LEEPSNVCVANVEVVKRSAVVFLIVGLLIGAAVIAWVSQKDYQPDSNAAPRCRDHWNGNLEHRATIKPAMKLKSWPTEFNKMTGALQNSYATLEQKVAQRTTEIKGLYEVTTAVNQSLSLKEISDAVIAKIVEIFRFDSMRIFLFDDRMEELQLQASFGTSANESAGRRSFQPRTRCCWPGRRFGEPMIFEDITTDARYRALSTTKATERAAMRFFAVFPIKTKSRVVGAILFNARQPRKLTLEETRLLESMSEHLAVAVEKASLFRQSERRAQQLAVLNTIGAAVSQSLDLQIVLASSH